jgi:hypothetical protein
VSSTVVLELTPEGRTGHKAVVLVVLLYHMCGLTQFIYLKGDVS